MALASPLVQITIRKVLMRDYVLSVVSPLRTATVGCQEKRRETKALCPFRSAQETKRTDSVESKIPLEFLAVLF